MSINTSKLIAVTMSMSLIAGTVVADSIKIGFNAPLTGFAASDGKSALNGAELAVEQINTAGGINGDMLELVVYDDQASPKEAVPVALKLIEKDNVIAGVSGSYSGSTQVAARVFQEAGIPYISAYAIHPDITKAGDFVFRTSFVGQVQGRAGAKLVGEVLGLKKVSIITLKNDLRHKVFTNKFKGHSLEGIINIAIGEKEEGIKILEKYNDD